MLGNMGGAGAGAGGMPDLASMMQNPMMMQMAQQLMANGGLERLMSNPSLANMVRLFPPRFHSFVNEFSGWLACSMIHLRSLSLTLIGR